ncbi:hypothetical protein OGAPHI_000283 [Ogataea philodendri]|uniref:Uncharacterized protein n=1 Tax=Ogataea philodendri TaxID=1378263 RepID=A0A9P8PH62_9ASCO|nr:uncharacterized protein OGAPHI_000283 [Ogataea philodendri]KAH3671580.1 hypothetical protein OGAPHI_000283 [Ogataea philodendri]
MSSNLGSVRTGASTLKRASNAEMNAHNDDWYNESFERLYEIWNPAQKEYSVSISSFGGLGPTLTTRLSKALNTCKFSSVKVGSTFVSLVKNSNRPLQNSMVALSVKSVRYWEYSLVRPLTINVKLSTHSPDKLSDDGIVIIIGLSVIS